MGGGYAGPERRTARAADLEDIKTGIARIAEGLEGQSSFRDWVHQKFDSIKESIYGNGKRGLVRDVDALDGKVTQLRLDFDKMDARIERVVTWALVSSISALGLIIFQIVSMIMSKVFS